LLTVLTVTSGCSWLQPRDSVEFQGVNFRSNAAHESYIGSIGLKRTRGSNRFELKFMPEWEDLVISNTTNFDRKLVEQLKNSLKLEGNLVGDSASGNAGFGNTTDKETEGKYHIFRIVDTKALVDQLNEDKNAELLTYLARSENYRIITSVIVVYSHSSTGKINTDANLDFALKTSTKGSLKIEAKIENEVVDSLSLSDGTIYAYEFSRLCWKDKEVYDILLDRNIWRGDSEACSDIAGAQTTPTM